MFSPRWHKVLRDLWLNKARTLLAILAIATGIFGVGTVLTGYAILTREINVNFMGTNPASAILYTDAVDGEMATTVASLPGVADAEAHRVVTSRILIAPGDWRRLLLFVIDDFDDLRVATFTSEQGDWPPADHEILIERSALPLINRQIGDMLQIQTPNGQDHDLRMSGIVHDPGQSPGFVDNIAYGYITLNTLEWLGETANFDELRLVVTENGTDAAHVTDVAYQARDVMESSGAAVSVVNVPAAGKHPHADQMSSLLFLLEAFGILALVMSAILVANIIAALLAQQIRQIGTMKTIGASTYQIVGLYSGSVLLLGVVALGIGIPAGSWAGRQYAAITAAFLNFNITSDFIPFWVYVVQIFIGLSVPLLAALFPVIRGSRITVREAISDYGIGDGQFGASRIDALVTRIRGMSRPLLLSLRNTFRRRSRLALTVGVLAIGGATFMSAINVGASWSNTIDVSFEARRYDITTRFTQPYPVALVEEMVRAVPGVSVVESWGQTKAVRKLPDGTDGIFFTLTGVPLTTDMIAFPILEGRWLQPGDTNALVVNHELLEGLEAEGISIGDQIALAVGGKTMEWTLVGGVREVGAPRRGQNIAASAYVNLDYLDSLTGTEGLTSNIRIQTTEHSEAAVRPIIEQLEQQYDGAGLKIMSIQPSTDRKQELVDHLLVIQVFLLLMAALVAAVGGLALASTMSINVLERTRELGIMRAIGASSDEVLQIVVVEGLVISILSWLVAVVLARPLSVIIGNFAGHIFIGAELDHVFPPLAMAGWLVLVIIIGIIASGIPAWRTAQLPVQDVLAYE